MAQPTKSATSSEDAPDKSYAENQAAWVAFHGLKVGSKVKVVRKFEANEGGFKGSRWDYCSGKANRQGTVISINGISSYHLLLKGGSSYPYFALEPA